MNGWAQDGLTDEQIAQNMGINVSTLYRWKNDHSEIRESLKKGKAVADYIIQNALFESAKNGNVTAQIFWLKNRKANDWREKQPAIESEQDNWFDDYFKKTFFNNK